MVHCNEQEVSFPMFNLKPRDLMGSTANVETFQSNSSCLYITVLPLLQDLSCRLDRAYAEMLMVVSGTLSVKYDFMSMTIGQLRVNHIDMGLESHVGQTSSPNHAAPRVPTLVYSSPHHAAARVPALVYTSPHHAAPRVPALVYTSPHHAVPRVPALVYSSPHHAAAGVPALVYTSPHHAA
eukprot:g31686.t1